MKLKKILASILCVAMVLSTMSFSVFAEDTDIIEVGTDKTYETWSAAVAAATDDDGDKAITYHIYGKVEVDKTGWVSPRGRSGATTINFVGMTDDAEICISSSASTIIATDAVSDMAAINYTNLILSRPNGSWAPDLAHANQFFTTWMRGATNGVVTYTGCTFLNGTCANTYNETVYTNCNFKNETSNALWIMGGNVEVVGGTVEAAKGIKTYNDNPATVINADISDVTFDVELTPAVIASAIGDVTLEDIDTTACEYGVIENGVAGGATANVTIDGETPSYVATTTNKYGVTIYTTDIEYAEAVTEEAVENGKVSEVVIPTAMITNANGVASYASLADAVAVLEEGDTLKIATGEYEGFDILVDNVTITGMTDDTVLTITAVPGNAFIGINAEGVSVENLTFVVSEGYEQTGDDLDGFDAVIGYWSNNFNAGSNVTTGYNVEGCTFINNSTTMGVAMFNFSSFEIVGNTFENFNVGIHTMSDGSAMGDVVISGNTFINVNEPVNVYWAQTGDDDDSIAITGNDFVSAKDADEIKITVHDYASTVAGTSGIDAIDLSGNTYSTATEVVLVDAATDVSSSVEATLENVENVVVDTKYAAVARIGEDKYFTSIQAAVDAAVAGDNEIVILPGTYDESFMVNQKESVNVTITAENKGDVTLTGTISVNGNRRQDGAETLTISNLVFDGSDKTAAHNFIIDSNGTANYPTYAHNVTVTNCDFIGNGDFDNAVVAFREPKAGSNNIAFDNVTATGLHSLIQVSNSKKITVTNSTITNGESVVNATGSAEVVFTNNIVDVENFAVRTGQGSSSTNTVADITMTGNTIKAGVTALAMRNATTTATMTDNSIVAPAAYTAENADASTINDIAITADEIDAAVNDNNEVIPESMSIGFVQVEPGLYNIVITATDDIYEFVGAELTFANTSKTVAGEDMNYEILGISGTTNAEKSIEKADTYALRLVDGAERMSGKDLVIGQVKFYGQGDINFTVSEGTVVTTEYGTNLGQYYTLDANTLTVDAITNGEVSEVTRTVVVNVAYKHALDGTYWKDAAGNAANQITVTLKDGFGNVYDAEDLTNGVATINNVKLGRLTVTLEAPGFRKYVYNTTLEAGADENDALVLNFWNDVKRDTVQSPLAEIETGKGFMAHNFVVGDIVMDYTVDEYDLAAVTSYYGMYELTDADKYIKYDLNRDGNIDIIDVHYVLHTLNN